MKRDLDRLASSTFDVVIIGGGIYGVSIAWEAALRGLSVALLEQEDFGHATSANSLRIIHGGLRYLQHGDIGRMRESIRERTSMMRIAPHLVHPFPCIMPTYGHGLRGREVMSIALLLNDLISFDRNAINDPQKHLPPSRLISAEECLRVLPGIDERGLTGGALWYDCQMYSSERLTLAFARSATECGATLANYTKVTGLLRTDKRVSGVTAVDRLSGRELAVCGRTVINAAGPWVDNVLEMLDDVRDVRFGIRLVKAVNIAVPRIFKQYGAGLSGMAVADDAQTNRLLFITPWRDHSLIGTTYAAYAGPPGDLHVTRDDVRTLLDHVNAIYHPARLKMEDVQYVYAGLVPASKVDHETGTAKRARHYEILDHSADGFVGLISVLGVKYTTARDVAQKVIGRVLASTHAERTPSRSATYPLYGGDIKAFEPFLEAEISKQPCGLDAPAIRALVYNYGSAYQEVLEYYDPDDLSPKKALYRARTLYAVEKEMAKRLSDVIFRRTELATGGGATSELIAFCAKVMGQRLGWNGAREQDEIRTVEQQLAATLAWQDKR